MLPKNPTFQDVMDEKQNRDNCSSGACYNDIDDVYIIEMGAASKWGFHCQQCIERLENSDNVTDIIEVTPALFE